MSDMTSRWPSLFNNPLTPRCPPAINGLLLVLSVLFVAQMLLPFGKVKAIDIAFYLFGLIVFFGYAGSLRRSLPAWAMLAAIVQLTVTWLFLLKDFPDIARSGPSLEDYLDKFGFIFIAVVLAGRDRWAMTYLGVLGGLVIAMPWILGGGLTDFTRGLESAIRVGFGVNPIRAAMYYSLALLGLLAFAPRIFLRPRFRWGRFVLWGLVVAYCLLCIVTTQTRGVFLALSVVLVLGFILLITLGRASRGTKAVIVGLFAGVVLVPTLVATSTGVLDKTMNRVASEMVVFDKMEAGNFEAMPDSSWGLRAQFLNIGLERIAERPLVGWGYRAGRMVLSEAGEDEAVLGHYRQLHNSYLETTLQYGLGGLLIILALFAWAVRGGYRAWRAGVMAGDIFAFAVSSITFFMICALFYGLFFDDDPGLMMISVLLGVPASFIFSHTHGRKVMQAQAATGR